MKDYRISAELTMAINHDFQQLVEELRSQHFRLDKEGYLAYRSPFENPGTENYLVFKFKPKVKGSTIYTIYFEGEIDNVAGILHNTFRGYSTKLCMIQVHLEMENYQQVAYSEIVKKTTNWVQASYDPNIFTLSHTSGAACLLMTTHVCFMTRSIKTFEEVNEFINRSLSDIKVFKPEMDFNLFTCFDF